MSCKVFMFLGLAIIVTLWGSPLHSQGSSHEPHEVITAENIQRLQSVMHIDFSELPDDVIGVDSGWFTLSTDGYYIALVRRDGGLVIFNSGGALVDTFTVAAANGEASTILDVVWSQDNVTVASLHTDGERYFASLRVVGEDEVVLLPFPEIGDMPVRLWLDESDPYIWFEAAEDGPQRSYYVIRVPIEEGHQTESLLRLPSGPEGDLDSFVRIGRIPAPLAITSTPDGLVKLWNLETGEITAQVQLDIAPVFGRVDETTGRHLAWRDPASESLQLLDFETGENQLIAPLGGEYVQAILLTPGADVVFAVAIGDDPVVVAWDTATGEQFDLGHYRRCSRVPDMVRLSEDGTTLVIGCDTGLDIWRIAEESS